MNEIILDSLDTRYNELYKEYGNQMMGLFIVGKINYGFSNDLKDIRFIMIYLPTFEELCFKKPVPLISGDVYILDIRYIYRILSIHESTALELLFTKYFKINEIYKDLFNKYFYNNREKLSRVSPLERVEKARDRAILAWHDDDHFEAARLLVSADLYVKNHPTEDCFHPSAPYIISYLNSVKEGKTIIYLDELKTSFDELIELVEDAEVDKNAVMLIKNGVVAIMELALRNSIDSESAVSALTKKEKEAFDKLKDELTNGVGIISISKLVDKTGISRPVWKNLFQKLEKDNLISVVNMGVKGTEIKILNKNLL